MTTLKNTIKSHHIDVSTFPSHTSQSTDQRLQNSLHLSHTDNLN